MSLVAILSLTAALHSNLVTSKKIQSRFYFREQRKKQLDWLARNTDVITTKSHSRFARKPGLILGAAVP
jgi:hypothetical protein